MDSPFGAILITDLLTGAGQKQSTIVSGTSAVQIIPAYVGNVNPRIISGTHVDIIGLLVTSINSAPANLTIADGSGNLYTMKWEDRTGNILYETPVIRQQTPNSAWTLTASANASGFAVTVWYQLREAFSSAY